MLALFFTTQSRLLTKPFEKIIGKGENTGNQHFLTMFSALSMKNSNLSATSNLSPTLRWLLKNVDIPEIVSFGKNLIFYLVNRCYSESMGGCKDDSYLGQLVP